MQRGRLPRGIGLTIIAKDGSDRREVGNESCVALRRSEWRNVDGFVELLVKVIDQNSRKLHRTT